MSLEVISRDAIAKLGGVKVTDLSHMNLAKPRALASAFQEVERRTGVPKYLLAAIAWTESWFNPRAVNKSSGAAGLMQLMPFNWGPYGIANDPFEPVGNITAGAKDLLAKGYGKKKFWDVMRGYNGFKSVHDPVKLAAFTLYFNRIVARWAYLAINRVLD